MAIKIGTKFERKLTCASKNDMQIWAIFTRALESLKIRILMEFFCQKLKMCELKIYREVICHVSEE